MEIGTQKKWWQFFQTTSKHFYFCSSTSNVSISCNSEITPLEMFEALNLI